jgi:hypothetical protein
VDSCLWKAVRDPKCQCTSCRTLEGHANQAIRECKRAAVSGLVADVNVQDHVPTPWATDPRPRDGADVQSNRPPRDLAAFTIQDLCPLPPSRQAADIRDSIRAASLSASCQNAITLETLLGGVT